MCVCVRLFGHIENEQRVTLCYFVVVVDRLAKRFLVILNQVP